MTAREVIAVLHKDGWYECASRGSHRQFKHPVKSGRVTVPVHSGDIKPNTLASIFNQAGIRRSK